jgi:hypothetical protein
MAHDPTGSHPAVRALCLTAAVGASRLFPAIACALALVLVPVADGATSDLAVSVSRLTVPSTIAKGVPVKFSVRYVVRGPARRRANAMVVLLLKGTTNRYEIKSNPALVRPAVWDWSVSDNLPDELAKGPYKVIATITLRRSGKVVDSTKRMVDVTVS